MRAISILVLGGLLGATGCVFTNVTAEETLRDAVIGLNDEVRWNRIDLAAQRVDARFVGRFRATHHDWHRELQIADSEVVHVQMGEDRGRATARVTFRWYDERTLLLSETTLQQKWKRTMQGYMLIEEEVADGNDRLLRVPESMREAVEAADEARAAALAAEEEDDA